MHTAINSVWAKADQLSMLASCMGSEHWCGVQHHCHHNNGYITVCIHKCSARKSVLKHTISSLCLQDIGSGVGFVHNTYMFDHPQKSVLRAPWTYSPQPLWSVGQIGLSAALPHAFRFLANQHKPVVALGHLLVVAVHALRGSWAVAKVQKGRKE